MPPAEVGLEGWAQWISMPLGLGHMLAVAPNPGVIGAHDDGRELLLDNGLLEDGIEQGPWFPLGAGENFVVSRPIFLGVARETNGPREGALANPAQDPKSHCQGSLQAALL